MILRSGYLALAMKLQEVAASMGQADIRARLTDALADQFRPTGIWAYLIDVFGDDKSGFVIYSCDSDIRKAPYSCSETGATIDTAAAVDVVPLTTYQEETTEGISEAGARHNKRDMTQLQTIHDHAVSLGANCSMSEANVPRGTNGELKLCESAATTEVIKLTEAKADHEIKLIAPGPGSSAFYPAEVLKRDGPKVFGKGTHVYLNHQTAAEEAQRPEGDVRNLAGVLTTPAVYHESHAKGPGLYARMKVFADHAQTVEEKAAHVGMSIRASGLAESGKKHNGLPILKELTGAESVDIVTRAGAGGLILTEAAKTANQQEVSDMDAAELKTLQESVATANATNALLLERAIKGDAREEATRILAGISLHEAGKVLVIENALRSIPRKDGALDTAKFEEIVNAEAKRIGAAMSQATGSGTVTGMGTPIVPVTETLKPEDIKAKSIRIFERLGHSKEAAERAVMGRV